MECRSGALKTSLQGELMAESPFKPGRCACRWAPSRARLEEPGAESETSSSWEAGQTSERDGEADGGVATRSRSAPETRAEPRRSRRRRRGGRVDSLKAALAKVLVTYYPLAGEVVPNAAGEPELLCSSRGVDFAEATADGVELRDVQLGLPDESVEKLVPKKKAGVMSVQVTKFKCGGAVVGCMFDHHVCDA
ncbi:hypothetical protein ACQ4PT_009907 [Festuca glaucescens]